MIRGLIENQYVGALKHKSAKAHAVLLTSREHPDLLCNVIARKQKPAKNRAQGLIIVTLLPVVLKPRA